MIHAAARLLNGHARQLLMLVEAGERHLVHDVVDLLLIQRQELMQRDLSALHKAVDHGLDFVFLVLDRLDRRFLFFLLCHGVILPFLFA